MRTLILSHGPAVRAAVTRIERNAQDVEEITADTFLVAWHRLDEVGALEHSGQRAWLVRTGRLTAFNRRRAKMRRRDHEEAIRAGAAFDEWEDPTAAVDWSVDVAALLQSLNPRYRAALVLDALGADGAEQARRLGVSVAAARTVLMRARAALAAAYHGTNQWAAREGDQ